MVTTGQTRYMRCRLATDDVLTQIMREYMEQSGTPHASIQSAIEDNNTFMNRLNRDEKRIIKTLTADGFEHFNISLMYKIARNFSDPIANNPTQGWGINPQEGDCTVEDDIERIRRCRNEFAHVDNPSISDSLFPTLFSRLRRIAHQAEKHLKNKTFVQQIQHYEVCILDPEIMNRFTQLEDKYRQEIADLKKLVETKVNGGATVTVYMDQSTQTEIVEYSGRTLEEEMMKATLKFPGIENAEENAALLTTKGRDLSTESIVFTHAEEGCLVVFVDIAISLLQDENLLSREMEKFVQSVFKVLPCFSREKWEVFFSIAEESRTIVQAPEPQKVNTESRTIVQAPEPQKVNTESRTIVQAPEPQKVNTESRTIVQAPEPQKVNIESRTIVQAPEPQKVNTGYFIPPKQKCFELCNAYFTIDKKTFKCEGIGRPTTNYVCKCSWNATGQEPNKVLVRIYGKIVQEPFPTFLTKSLLVFNILAERNLGPRCYGYNQEGRIEELYTCKHLKRYDLKFGTYPELIARKLAEIHAQDMPLTKAPTFLIDFCTPRISNIQSWLLTAEIVDDNVEIINSFDFRQNLRDVMKATAYLKSEVVFSHNGLTAGDILLLPEIKETGLLASLKFINFEYSAYNYRAYDLSMLFIECCIEYRGVEKKPWFSLNDMDYPSVETRKQICRAYLSARSNKGDHVADEDVNRLFHETEICELAVHLVWTIWGVDQHIREDQIPFGYMEYAVAHLEEYKKKKETQIKKGAGF